MSSEPIEPRAGLAELMREHSVAPESIAAVTEKLFSRYDFFTKGSAEHPAKYPEGGVPRWMIIGSVEDERVRAFEYLVREGVLVKTSSDPDDNHARYCVIGESNLASMVRNRDAPVTSEAVERAARGVLANYSSGLGPYGVPESVLVDAVAHGTVALDRLVGAGVLVLAPMSDDMGPDERHYTLSVSLDRSP